MNNGKRTNVMQVKNETQTGLSAEMKILPPWAVALAAIGFAGAQLFMNIVVGRQPGAPPAWALILIGLLLGTVVGCYILLIGYVSRDARRRGMSPILWTVVAIVIPNGLGIILYFLLRQPRQSACPQCGNALQPGFNFCPELQLPTEP